MEYTFKGFLVSSIKKNRIIFIILTALSVLSVIFAAVGAEISSFTYAVFFLAFISAAVCFICVFITTVFMYYRAIHKSGIAAFEKPLGVILGAIASNILLCAIIALFASSTFFSAVTTLERTVDETSIAESQERDDLADIYLDFQKALSEKGYESISYFASFAFYISIMYINTLSVIICAVSFAKLFSRTLFGSILGFFFFDTVGAFIINILTGITGKFAQGIGAVTESIRNFYSAASDISDPITAIKNAAVQLPYSSDFVKLYIFSALCTLVTVISFIIASKAVISKDITKAENNDNKNNNI